MQRLGADFFQRDVLDVAPELLGKSLVINAKNITSRYTITEVEAYRGEEDMACHARNGRTRRTDVMYWEGGHIYVYLIYGMYWMLNFVTSKANIPQAVLVRAIEGFEGPGKLTRQLGIDKSYYGVSLIHSTRIWVEDEMPAKYKRSPRVGIDYATEPWRSKLWRYIKI